VVPIRDHRHQPVLRPAEQRQTLRRTVHLDLRHGTGLESLGEDEVHVEESLMGNLLERPLAVNLTDDEQGVPGCQGHHPRPRLPVSPGILSGDVHLHGAVKVVLDCPDPPAACREGGDELFEERGLPAVGSPDDGEDGNHVSLRTRC
jgi:hypothetical protein